MTNQSRILITTGDPSGIGPEITLKAAATSHDACIVAIGDREVLQARAEVVAKKLNRAVTVTDYDEHNDKQHRANVLPIIHRPCQTLARAGEFNPGNAEYIIGCIDAAVDLCRAKNFDAMVTAPVNKAVINRAGIAFTGHTEWIAERCDAPTPVMMLVAGDLRVCLLTTHVPLSEVPRLITAERLRDTIIVILADLTRRFGIKQPRLGVCGLEPARRRRRLFGTRRSGNHRAAFGRITRRRRRHNRSAARRHRLHAGEFGSRRRRARALPRPRFAGRQTRRLRRRREPDPRLANHPHLGRPRHRLRPRRHRRSRRIQPKIRHQTRL